MYLEELAEIEKLSETEEERLFFEAVNGDSMAKMKVIPESNLILVKGSIPGAKGAYLTIEK